MKRKLSTRLMSLLTVLALWSGAAQAALVYSDTVLARGPEFASTTELALGGSGTYRITTTDLRWLDAPLGALSFGAFTATAPIKTMVGAGTIEFYHAGQGKVFLQLYARPAGGRSAGLIGVHVDSVAVVALPASLWLLLSSLAAAGFWGRLQQRAAALSDVVGGASTPPVKSSLEIAARKLAKRLLPKTGRTFIEWAGPRFGRRYALTAYATSLLRRDGLVRVPIKGFPGEFAYLRPTKADQYVYDEVFLSGEYRLPVEDARFIIDAGGHIGLTSLLFALRWPHAKIAVVEPAADNFRVLQVNLGRRPNVTLHQAAVWSHRTELSISNPNDASVAFRLEPGGSMDVEAVTIRELMDRNGFAQVDLLKLDVEGAEIEVFASSAAWINTVDALIVELHDRFRPGCREALLTASDGQGFATFEQGENTILLRDRAAGIRVRESSARRRLRSIPSTSTQGDLSHAARAPRQEPLKAPSWAPSRRGSRVRRGRSQGT